MSEDTAEKRFPDKWKTAAVCAAGIRTLQLVCHRPSVQQAAEHLPLARNRRKDDYGKDAANGKTPGENARSEKTLLREKPSSRRSRPRESRCYEKTGARR